MAHIKLVNGDYSIELTYPDAIPEAAANAITRALLGGLVGISLVKDVKTRSKFLTRYVALLIEGTYAMLRQAIFHDEMSKMDVAHAVDDLLENIGNH